MKLLEAIMGNCSKARQQLDAIAHREAAGEVTDKDAAILVELLEASRVTEDDYRQLVKLTTKHAALEAEGAKLPEAKAAHADAKAAKTDEELRWLKAKEAHEAKIRELEITLGQTGSALQKARRCSWEAEQLETGHPDLFNVPRPDLDAHGLCYHDNTITHYDPEAPRLQVDLETFNREQARRHRIHEAARKRAMAEYQNRKAAWIATLPHDRGGMPVFGSDDTFANFTIPTWADILDRGWHRELDRPPHHAAA